MGIGIQIKKPDHSPAAKPVLVVEEKNPAPTLSPILYLLLFVSFPACFVAFYFFIQARSV